LGNGRAQIEVGREQDLDAQCIVGTRFFPTADRALEAQHAWLTNPRRADLLIRKEKALDWDFVLCDGDLRVAGLSAAFARDMWDIGKARKNWVNWLGHARSMGLRTIAVAADSPQLERMHAPWRSSGFVLAPLLTSFCNTKTKETT
jgi:hypothetical protein